LLIFRQFNDNILFENQLNLSKEIAKFMKFSLIFIDKKAGK